MRLYQNIIAMVVTATLCGARPVPQDDDPWWMIPPESDEPVPGTFIVDPSYHADKNDVECELVGAWMKNSDFRTGILSVCASMHGAVIPHKKKICYRAEGYPLGNTKPGAVQGSIKNNNAEYAYVVSREHCIEMMTDSILPKCQGEHDDTRGGTVWDNEWNLVFKADPNANSTAICEE